MGGEGEGGGSGRLHVVVKEPHRKGDVYACTQ
jgi:hypothetical protein